jgi:glycosyltransferase involved in cell wall biosynthesis
VAETPVAPLLVFADDWGRHPSSCQHLVRRLLPRHAVHWVNTIGMRTPRLDAATLSRGFEKLRHWAARKPEAKHELPANLRVHNPLMWPWLGGPFGRALNRRLLLRHLLPLVRSLPRPPVALTTLPITSLLIGRLPVERWVYYCVDDFTEWPGLDRETLRSLDEDVIRGADTLIAVSQTLRERLAARGRDSHLLTHGVDLDLLAGGQGRLPPLDLPRPWVVFWGTIDRRMDVAWVKRLAADLAEGTILLVGPQADPDPELVAIPRVATVPPMAYEDLPALARTAAVLVMPYADLPVTRAMQPLKLKEYLATGRPVVVRDLPANRPWGDCLDLATTAEAFSATVRRRLETGLPAEQGEARERLREESWEHKAAQLAEWAGLVPQPREVGHALS